MFLRDELLVEPFRVHGASHLLQLECSDSCEGCTADSSREGEFVAEIGCRVVQWRTSFLASKVRATVDRSKFLQSRFGSTSGNVAVTSGSGSTPCHITNVLGREQTKVTIQHFKAGLCQKLKLSNPWHGLFSPTTATTAAATTHTAPPPPPLPPPVSAAGSSLLSFDARRPGPAECASVPCRRSSGMERLAGRVALVTGASSGIGEQVARMLVRAGLVVVGVARREQRLAELAASLSADRGTLHTLVADVSREEEVRRVYQWIDDKLGGVTVVVNNAAVLSLAPLQDMDTATVMQLVNTNVAGVMLSCREALLNMKKHQIRDGHIVNINSVAGHQVLSVAPYSMGAYAATKHAVTALCKGLRFDAQQIPGFKIRVTSISPGSVSTEMTPKGYVESLPDPDLILKPADVANAVLYALSCPQCVEISELTIHPTGDNL